MHMKLLDSGGACHSGGPLGLILIRLASGGSLFLQGAQILSQGRVQPLIEKRAKTFRTFAGLSLLQAAG